jgi:hemolysin activation/secretion protein
VAPILGLLFGVATARAETPPVVSAVIGLSDAAQLLPPETRAEGVDLSRVGVPDPEGLAARLRPILGAPVDMQTVARLREAVTAHYQAQGRPFVDVGVPEQDVTEGVVQLVITEFRVGRIAVEGNRWTRDARIRAAAGLTEGAAIDKPALDARLGQLGTGRFLTVTPEFRPGTTPGTTDVTLRAADRFPLEFTAAISNTGAPATGWERIALGVTWGDAFGLGHTIGWQFSTSPDFWHDRGSPTGKERPPGFVGNSLSWQVPLPWGHSLSFNGGLMRQSPRLGPDLGARGRTLLAGASYNVPLGPPRFLGAAEGSQEIAIAYDYKRSNNDLSFGGLLVQQGFNEVSQFTLRYTLARPDALGMTQLLANAVGSPGGMTPENTDRAFQPQGLGRSGTPGARARYAYGRATVTRITPLPAEFALVLRGTGQIATGTLLPSEQLPLAGVDAVRGYQEFGVAASQGVTLSAELRLPGVALGQLLSARLPEDGFQPHLFADWGRGWNPTPSDAAPARNRAASVGAGARYEIAPNLTLRLEQGWQLIEAKRQSAASPFLHVAVTTTW